MRTHLGVMVLYALLISTVFGALLRPDAASQAKMAARVFGGLMLFAFVVSWLLYLLYR